MTSNPSPETEIMPRQTLPIMAEAYRLACEELKQGLDLIDGAMKRVDFAFGDPAKRSSGAFGIRMESYRSHLPPFEDLELEWRQTAWRILVDRMELRRICSVARFQEIEKQLANPKELPEITAATMLAMVEQNAQSIPEFFRQSVVECFEMLRPWRHGDSGDGYKRNTVYQVNERIVVTWACEPRYSGGLFRLSYRDEKTQLLRCLDNVMHLLDGKGTVPTHAGPLVDALNGPDNKGHVETDYFEARCYKNRNIHLRFKRLDLLAELNRIGSGGAWQLPGERKPTGTKKEKPVPTPKPEHLELFATPDDLARRMVDLANILPGASVLEPSAGSGALIAPMTSADIGRLTAVELAADRAEDLRRRFPQATVVQGDFLQQNGSLGMFDRIIMNPPFHRAVDMAHILHAWRMLKPGGKLVALCAAGPAQTVALKKLADDNSGSWEILPPGSFAEAGTQVNVALITANKP